ncbi:alpha/beta hydrolase [Clostridium sp.]|uniref:alpha/beta hydrolase n=1 Tax=Clostridium sp. TaxID=1506 RepID=UPI003F3FF899
MEKYKIQEKIVMIPLMSNIIKLNLIRDRDIEFTDIKYGENLKQYYRIYKAKNNDKPLIYFIHGGGWWHGSPRMCSYIGKYFNKLGYNIVLPAYRLVPLFKYPVQVNDVFTAFTHFKNNNEDAFKHGVIVMGFSAGGELSANLLFNQEMQKKYKVDPSIFKKAVILSGVLDFDKCNSKHSKRLIENYLGEEESLIEKNPVNLIHENEGVKVLCVHGDKDPLIDIENSYSFIERLNELGGVGKILVSKGKHHSDITSLIINGKEDDSKEILEFIKANEEI